MQDRYSADIGDFGKFQLLRYLFLDSSYSLSQLWYLYPNESHNNDGMYINYFEKVKGFDKELEDSFKNIISSNRSVKALEDANLLNNIKYFNEIIKENRSLDYRKEWFKKALDFSKNSDFILTDSDNGIATKCNKNDKSMEILNFDKFKQRSNSGKYIFFDEIKELYEVSKCLIIYHHLNRCFSHDLQIEVLKELLKKEFKTVFAIKHKPYSPRVYLFLCKDSKKYDFLLNRLKDFENKFSIHWKLFL